MMLSYCFLNPSIFPVFLKWGPIIFLGSSFFVLLLAVQRSRLYMFIEYSSFGNQYRPVQGWDLCLFHPLVSLVFPTSCCRTPTDYCIGESYYAHHYPVGGYIFPIYYKHVDDSSCSSIWHDEIVLPVMLKHGQNKVIGKCNAKFGLEVQRLLNILEN